MANLRYMADSRLTYGHALLALVRHARASDDDFAFGPLQLQQLEQSGLEVSGPDLTAVRDVLAEVPGLVLLPG